MLEALSMFDMAKMIAALRNRWVLFLNLPTIDELVDNGYKNFYDPIPCAPYLSVMDYDDELKTGLPNMETSLIIICNSEEHCTELYNQTVGDNGPTSNNQYSGPLRAYACTIGPDGKPYNENT